VDDLYRRNGSYEYSGGWNIHALIASRWRLACLAIWWCPACWTVPPWLHPWSACLTLWLE
jgi:cytosine/uracil/thiamine/allantoin permease